MPLKFNSNKPSKKDFGNIGKGMYPARIVQIVDFGMHEEENYNGDMVMSEKVWIQFEFPTKRIELVQDGETVSRPRWLGKEYKLSDNDKSNLYQVVTNLYPDFNFEEDSLEDLLGLGGMATVGVTSGGKDKIVAVNPPVEGMQIGELENPTTLFDLGDPDLDVFKSLPNWMQKRITESMDYAESALERLIKVDGYKVG